MDELKKQEKDKYDAIWKERKYRVNSPGLRSVDRFMALNPKGETLVDVGCGTGRAGRELSKHFTVTLFDISPSAVECNELPFVEGCIWEGLPEADIAYCCDVMEHIPEEKIDDVLKNLYDSYSNVYLRISLKEDTFGMTVIGKPLHLTVKEDGWWKGKLSKLWTIEHEEVSFPIATYYLAKH